MQATEFAFGLRVCSHQGLWRSQRIEVVVVGAQCCWIPAGREGVWKTARWLRIQYQNSGSTTKKVVLVCFDFGACTS